MMQVPNVLRNDMSSLMQEGSNGSSDSGGVEEQESKTLEPEPWQEPPQQQGLA